MIREGRGVDVVWYQLSQSTSLQRTWECDLWFCETYVVSIKGPWIAQTCHQVCAVHGSLVILVDRVSASEGCEAAVTARKRCGWVMFTECIELLYCKRFSLIPQGLFIRAMYGQVYCMEVKHGA